MEKCLKFIYLVWQFRICSAVTQYSPLTHYPHTCVRYFTHPFLLLVVFQKSIITRPGTTLAANITSHSTGHWLNILGWAALDTDPHPWTSAVRPNISNSPHPNDSIKESKLYSASYWFSSQSSPKFSNTDLSPLLDWVPCTPLSAEESLFLRSFSTENRSSSCPVSIVCRLELSCVITELAILSLNFWSLKYKDLTLSAMYSTMFLVDGWMDGWMEGQTYRQTDGQTLQSNPLL